MGSYTADMLVIETLLIFLGESIFASTDITKWSSNQVQHTLLLGGYSSSSGYSTSIELITPTMTCTASIYELPVEREAASAVVLGASIYYCGGYNGTHYTSSCHSYDLNDNANPWIQEDSMKIARGYFGMSVIGSTIYATGGIGDNLINSAESFEVGRGWRIEERMEMPQTRFGHCSAYLDSHLIVIGGMVSGSPSASVISFDTQDQNKQWKNLHSLNLARYEHACQEGAYEGIDGIFVTGGGGLGNQISVEFYDKDVDTWTVLGDMKTNRRDHSLSIVNGKLVAAGGNNVTSYQLTSVETLNGAEWIVTNNLQSPRENHAAVSVPAGIITC